jgi:hypothetical protein
VLDVGTGLGHNAIALAEMGMRVSCMVLALLLCTRVAQGYRASWQICWRCRSQPSTYLTQPLKGLARRQARLSRMSLTTSPSSR